jgi:hypothetical protein
MGLNFLNKASAATVKGLAADLRKLAARRDDLTSQLATQNSALAAHQAALQQGLIDGAPDATIAKAESSASDASRRISAISAAIATIDSQLAAVKSQHDELISRELGNRLADEREADYRSAEKKLRTLMAALVDATPAMERIADIAFIARQVSDVTRTLPADIEAALRAIEMDVICHVSGLRNGSVKPTLPQAAAPALVTTPKHEVERRVVLALAPIEWAETDGMHACGRYSQANLPTELADKAVALGYALEWSNERVRQLVRVHASEPGLPGAKANVNIDTVTERATGIFGRDRIAAESGMKASDGKSYVVHGGI